MAIKSLLLMAVLAVALSGVAGRREGAPICGHTPGHGSKASGSGGYTVTLDKASYTPGGTVSVTVSGSNTFRG